MDSYISDYILLNGGILNFSHIHKAHTSAFYSTLSKATIDWANINGKDNNIQEKQINNLECTESVLRLCLRET